MFTSNISLRSLLLSHFQMEICDTDYCYNFLNYGIVGGGVEVILKFFNVITTSFKLLSAGI